MPKTLISFLGKFHRPEGGGYREVAYRFDNRERPITTAFFGWAAWQHLRGSADPPEQWVILGTPTSSWDCLYELFAGEFPDGLEAWSGLAAAELSAGGVSKETLNAFSVFAGGLGVPVLKLQIISMESDAAFVALHDVLEDNARVVLDITHGLRALPVVTLLALGALRWMKDVRIDDVLYGNLEGTSPDLPEKGVVSLRDAARLSELTPSLARIALVDDLEEAEKVCRELRIGKDKERLELRRQSILTAMLYPREAVTQSGKVRRQLANWPAAGATVVSVVGDWIRRCATAASGGGAATAPIAERLVNQAEKFLARRDYLRCMLQLNEANRIMLADQLGQDKATQFGELWPRLVEDGPMKEAIIKDLKALNYLRNHTAHGVGDPPGGKAAELLREPEQIRGFLETMLGRAKQVVAGTKFQDLA